MKVLFYSNAASFNYRIKFAMSGGPSTTAQPDRTCCLSDSWKNAQFACSTGCALTTLIAGLPRSGDPTVQTGACMLYTGLGDSRFPTLGEFRQPDQCPRLYVRQNTNRNKRRPQKIKTNNNNNNNNVNNDNDMARSKLLPHGHGLNNENPIEPWRFDRL